MSAGSTIFCYDANGNMTQKIDSDSTSYTYDAENRMTADSQAGVRGYGVENRVEPAGSGTARTQTEFVGEEALSYRFRAGQRIAMRQGSAVSYLYGNHLGSTSLVTDASGAAVTETRDPLTRAGQPYGQAYWQWGATRTDFGFTPSGKTALRVQAGQRLDGFGLMDYNARYYSSTLGRFISPDSIIPQPGSPLAWDRYAYTYSNPVNFTDPGGQFICEDSMPYCDPQKLTYDWEIPDTKFISNFEDRPLEIMRAARMNYILLRYQLYFTYGDKVVNSKGKINDQYFIATMISKEFGGYAIIPCITKPLKHCQINTMIPLAIRIRCFVTTIVLLMHKLPGQPIWKLFIKEPFIEKF